MEMLAKYIRMRTARSAATASHPCVEHATEGINQYREQSLFKWIKQNLKIKSFLGTSENAVMSQIWVAMIHYLLIAYLKFLHGFKLGMTELTNRIRDTLMQNQSLLEVLSLDRKILEKPPNWNLPVQEELFSPLLL